MLWLQYVLKRLKQKIFYMIELITIDQKFDINKN